MSLTSQGNMSIPKNCRFTSSAVTSQPSFVVPTTLLASPLTRSIIHFLVTSQQRVPRALYGHVTRAGPPVRERVPWGPVEPVHYWCPVRVCTEGAWKRDAWSWSKHCSQLSVFVRLAPNVNTTPVNRSTTISSQPYRPPLWQNNRDVRCLLAVPHCHATKTNCGVIMGK